MKFDNIRLLVNDFDRSFNFYNGILGLECTWGKLGDNFASFNIGNHSGLALFKAELMSAAIGSVEVKKNEILQDKIAIILKVGCVDESYRTLQSKGLNFLAEPKDMAAWGIRVTHFRDPENNLIELFSDLPNQD